jgi:hypothetical protein
MDGLSEKLRATPTGSKPMVRKDPRRKPIAELLASDGLLAVEPRLCVLSIDRANITTCDHLTTDSLI